MDKLKIFGYVILFLIIFNTSLHTVNAASISVTKAIIEYNNVLRGGYAEDVLYVSTDAPFDVPISYELLGDTRDWITISPDLNDPNNTLYISNANYQTVRIIIQPPSDTPLGVYTGYVRILTGTLNTLGGQYGSQLQAAFMIRIRIELTGTEFLSCSGGGVVLKDTEIGSPIEYYMTVSNAGNIRVKPTATIDIWNQDQTKLLTTKKVEFGGKEVLPTINEAFSNTFANDLRIGQYWAYVTIEPCGNSELTTFNVYEKGTIVDSGELIRLDVQPWAKIGDVVPITAAFRNTGGRTVSAKFKGIVTSDNRIVETIDSEFYDIPPSETGNIIVYFTPKKFGQYIISGRVLYNNKLSFEKSTVLNVNEGVEKSNNTWIYILILIIIIIIILLLLIRIRKKKHNIRRL
ncbi:MAG: hypothetical protein ACP5OA_01025 [Candidatus Woesearchaeota archaeon]